MSDPGPSALPPAPDTPQAAAVETSALTEHLPLVRMIAARLYKLRWNETVPFEDYYQMGATGLVEASTRFDPSRGVPFRAFASWRISGSILNGLEQATERHQQLAARKHLIKERAHSLSVGEEPAAPADDSLEATLSRLAAMAIGLAVGFMLEGTGMYSAGDESTSRDGYAALASRQLGLRLRQTVRQLPVQERQVMEEHYFHSRPFSEIAIDMGLTRGRISQIHKRATERLRELLAEAHGKSFEA